MDFGKNTVKSFDETMKQSPIEYILDTIEKLSSKTVKLLDQAADSCREEQIRMANSSHAEAYIRVDAIIYLHQLRGKIEKMADELAHRG